VLVFLPRDLFAARGACSFGNPVSRTFVTEFVMLRSINLGSTKIISYGRVFDYCRWHYALGRILQTASATCSLRSFFQLLSVNLMKVLPVEHAPRFRLLVSPVVPPFTHVGIVPKAFVFRNKPFWMVILVPLLNSAREPSM
jgi:hypothetical protein